MELEKACKKLIIKEPFWGLIMLGFNKVYSQEVPTLCVTKDGLGLRLLVNESFWSKHTDEQQLALLLHELHHICFGHLFMSKDFVDKELFNIAADAEVNCYIDGLPDTRIDVTKYGLPQKKGVKWYYENWPKKQNDQKGQSGQNGQSNKIKPSPVDDHSPWKDIENSSKAQKELIKSQCDEIIKQAAIQITKQCGKIPDCLKDYIKDLLKDKPRIYDWKSHFRRLIGCNIDVNFKKSYQRESKRFPDSMGIKLKKRSRALVCIDTSGSISNKELADFLVEINHIYKAGVSVRVIECDADIQNEWEFTGLKQEVKINGKGGTDFKPAVEYYNKRRKEYNTFIYFTDGYASIENLHILGNNIIWIISQNGNVQQYPGKVIYIPTENKQTFIKQKTK